MVRKNEAYLGDGLYASFDGNAFTLRAPRADGDHFVVLEPGVFVEFLRFASGQQEPWCLSPSDSALFLDAITNAPEPNEALRAAAGRYKRSVE